jgi:hypothetical protein
MKNGDLVEINSDADLPSYCLSHTETFHLLTKTAGEKPWRIERRKISKEGIPQVRLHGCPIRFYAIHFKPFCPPSPNQRNRELLERRKRDE